MRHKLRRGGVTRAISSTTCLATPMHCKLQKKLLGVTLPLVTLKWHVLKPETTEMAKMKQLKSLVVSVDSFQIFRLFRFGGFVLVFWVLVYATKNAPWWLPQYFS